MLSLVTFTGEIAITKVVLHKEKKKKINKQVAHFLGECSQVTTHKNSLIRVCVSLLEHLTKEEEELSSVWLPELLR